MTEEEYITSFKTLSKTTLRNIEIYYPLAECMHLYSCPLGHDKIEGALICENLEKYYRTTVKDYEEYIINACITNNNRNIRLSFIRLYNSGIEMNFLLDELNSVYYFGQVPVDMGDEWEFYFSNLESTLNEGESLFDTYYDLAVYIHKLGCTCNHTINEYDAYICDNMKLTKNWEE